MLNIIDILITDRTASDVSRHAALARKSFAEMTAEEQLEWSTSMKGSYNATDLNRVGQAIKYVENQLHAYGYTIHTTPKTDWTMDDIPTLEQLNHVIADVQTCRNKLSLPSSTPSVPVSMELFNYEKANDIEKILKQVYESLMKIVEGMIYFSGDMFCGELYSTF